jgi:hypothetical protein
VKRIINRAALAAALATSLLCGASPSWAAPRASHTGHAAGPHGHGRSAHRHHHLGGTFAGPLLPDPGEGVPGSWHINRNGLPYQVPYPCAYPLGADASGAERFQTFGCPLP